MREPLILSLSANSPLRICRKALGRERTDLQDSDGPGRGVRVAVAAARVSETTSRYAHLANEDQAVD
jgi:hypothetical protein